VAKALKKKETFQLIDPNATDVLLVGDFTDWEDSPIILKQQKDGIWKTTVELEPGQHEYRFLVDGQWRDDLRCSFRKSNPFGGENCIRDVAP
jgi:1,4-alpha-glucan branching enzyme